jgi:hypothetical protein
MFPLIEIVAVMVSVAAAEADRLPTFNVEPHCHAVAAKAVPAGGPAACIRLEQKAREQLVKEWAEFIRTEKDHCLPLSAMAGEPTYTELLTCLEVARDARLLRQKERGATDTTGHHGDDPRDGCIETARRR